MRECGPAHELRTQRRVRLRDLDNAALADVRELCERCRDSAHRLDYWLMPTGNPCALAAARIVSYACFNRVAGLIQGPPKKPAVHTRGGGRRRVHVERLAKHVAKLWHDGLLRHESMQASRLRGPWMSPPTPCPSFATSERWM